MTPLLLRINELCLIVVYRVFVCRDGIPPYRYRKQHRKEMHESAKANGRVPLPHIPVSYTDTTHLASYQSINDDNMNPGDLIQIPAGICLLTCCCSFNYYCRRQQQIAMGGIPRPTYLCYVDVKILRQTSNSDLSHYTFSCLNLSILHMLIY